MRICDFSVLKGAGCVISRLISCSLTDVLVSEQRILDPTPVRNLVRLAVDDLDDVASMLTSPDAIECFSMAQYDGADTPLMTLAHCRSWSVAADEKWDAPETNVTFLGTSHTTFIHWIAAMLMHITAS